MAKIKHVWIHPWYVKATHNWDFAVAQLNQKFNYTDVILPVCLPPSDSYDVGGEEWVVVTGFGSTGNKNVKQVLKQLFCFEKNNRYFHRFFVFMELEARAI